VPIIDTLALTAQDSATAIAEATKRGLAFPVGKTILLGRTSRTGLLTVAQRFTETSQPFIWFVTDCCGAAVKGGESGVYCKGCYSYGVDEYGDVYTIRFHGEILPPVTSDWPTFLKGQQTR